MKSNEPYNKHSAIRKYRTTHKPSIQQMKIKFPLHIDTCAFAMGVPEEDETEFLIELFIIFDHQHVIEAYKEVQQRNPDLFPPLLEEQ